MNDAKGNPIPGAAVTFTVTQGPGSITALGSQPGTIPNSVVVTTDSTGEASADFLSSTIGQNRPGYASTTITASSPGAGNVTLYMTTTPQGSAAQDQANNFQLPAPRCRVRPAAPLRGELSSRWSPLLECRYPTWVSRLAAALAAMPLMPPAIIRRERVSWTDANGNASHDVVLSGVVGTGTFYGTVGYFQNTPNFNIW